MEVYKHDPRQQAVGNSEMNFKSQLPDVLITPVKVTAMKAHALV